MKMRLGFVSNSSSASFVLDTNGLSAKKIRKIVTQGPAEDDAWAVTHHEDGKVSFFTVVDNFDLPAWIRELLPDADARITNVEYH
jgi:hypothetical protein